MKRILIFILMGGLALLFPGFWTETMANSTGGAPTVMCMDCHSMPKGAEIRVDKLPKNFKPGSSYVMIISVKSTVKSMGDIQGGFAASVSGGELIVVDPTHTQKSDGYITHTAEGARERSWKIKWQAPRERKAVTLNISVIAANGDFAPANDGFARREFVLQPE